MLNHAQRLDDWFSSITPVSHPPHEGITNELLNRFGIKSALDIIKFMQSPDGKVMAACINQAHECELAALERSDFLGVLEFTRKQHLAYFLLSLKHDKQKALEHARAIEQEEQQSRLLHLYQKTLPTLKQHNETPRLSIEETFAYYEKARESLLVEMARTVSETTALEHELALLEENIALFLAHKDATPKLESHFANGAVDHNYIDLQMHRLMQAYEKGLASLQSMTIDPINETFVERWNTLDRHQVEASLWNDLRNMLKPKQSIVQRNGVLYLLDEGMSFEALSLEARQKAAEAYVALKPKLEKTRLTQKENEQTQEAAFGEKRKHLEKQIDFERQKTHLFITQLNGLDDTLSALTPLMKRTGTEQSQHMQLTLQLKPAPRPSFSRIQPLPIKTTRPSPEPTVTSMPTAQANLLLQLEQCRLRCQQPLMQQPKLSTQQICQIANTARATLIETLKTKSKELIPGTLPSPSLLSMLMTLNKTPLNIEKRLKLIPEQRFEAEKENLCTAPIPTPMKNPQSPY